MTTANVRAFARLVAFAASLSANGAFAQQAAEPAQELPPLEVTAKKAAKKAPAKKAQAKAAPKAAPQPIIASPYQDPSGLPSGVAPVQNYVAGDSTTGTKTDTPLRETPQSVSVVGAEQIRDQGARTLQESLRYVPGVLADGFGYDSRGDYIIVRGIEASYFLDGLRTPLGYYVNRTALDPYALERVEVLRGPGSMLYGQSSTGGIVNAISKRPQAESHREITAEYGSYDFKQVKTDMTGALTPDGKWLYRIIGVARDADTQVDYVENDHLLLAPSLTYRPTNDTSLTLLTSFQKDESGSTQQFLPQAGTLYRNIDGRRVPRSQFLGEPTDYYDTEGQSVAFLFDHRFDDTFSMHHGSRYSHTENAYDSTYPAILTQDRIFQLNAFLTGGATNAAPFDPSAAPFPTVLGFPPNESNMARARTIRFTDTDMYSTDTNVTAKFETGPIAHKVTGGYDYTRYDAGGRKSGTLVANLIPTGLGFPSYYEQPSFDIYNPVYGLNSPLIEFETGLVFSGAVPLYDFDELQEQHGIYIQDQLRIGPWVAVLGLRHDWLNIEGASERGTLGGGVAVSSYKTKDEATTGRAALLYEFDFGMSPYVSYSTSFDPQPGATVRASLTDPSLSAADPLEGEQVEIGFKYQPNGVPLIVNAAIYELTEKNRLVQPDILADPLQGADVRIRGFEFEAAGQLTPNIRVIGTYSYTDAEYERYEYYEYNKGTDVEGVPKHQASLWGLYTVHDGDFKGLSFGAGVRYIGETTDVGQRQLFPYDGTVTELYKVTTPSYTLFDAMVAYETPDWRWQISGQNLEDKYHVVSCTADRGDCGIGQGRTIVTGFTYKF